MNKLLIRLTIARPGLSVQITPEIIDTMADKEALSARKKLLCASPVQGELEIIDAMASELEQGIYAPDQRRQLTKRLHELATKRARLVNELIVIYPELIKQDKKTLRDLFDPNDYPSAKTLKEQFVFKWRFINI